MKRFDEVDAAFRVALDLGPGERADYLVRLRADDPELYRGVVELLQLSEEAEGLDATMRRVVDDHLRSDFEDRDSAG